MKKLLTLVIATIVTITFANAQTNWVNHTGDNRISVKFPAEPKEVIEGTFAAHGKDSVVYVFTIVDFVKVANIDSTALAPIKNSTEFTDQLKVGMSQSLPDVTFPEFKIGTWRGFTSYSSVGVDSKKKKYNVFMVLIGNKMYSFSTISDDGVSMAGRDAFVNSITLTD